MDRTTTEAKSGQEPEHEAKEASEKARRRMEVVSKVLSGTLEATEGALALGISRQAYYGWEGRFIEAALAAMEDREPGRPKSAATEPPLVEELRRELAERERQVALLSQAVQLKDLMAEYRATVGDGSDSTSASGKKKSRRRRK